MKPNQVQNLAQHKEYVGAAQTLSNGHFGPLEAKLDTVSDLKPATGAEKPWGERIDPGSCFYIGSAQGGDILAFLAYRVTLHRALLLRAILPSLAANAEHRHHLNLALHYAAAVHRFAQGGRVAFDLAAPLPGPSCVPGLMQMAPATFGDALYCIAFELHFAFPILAPVIRQLPDAYDAAELAQALDLARRVVLAGENCKAGEGDEWPTEAFMIQQFDRWSKQWQADPTGEENAAQIRAIFPGQTLAQILPRHAVCKPIAKAKPRRPQPKNATVANLKPAPARHGTGQRAKQSAAKHKHA